MAAREFIVTEEPFLEQVYSPSSPDTPVIDFVFVHGLNPSGRPNHAFQTWTDDSRQTPWPYELLPGDFPRARIWIFGYNSNITRGVSEANISDHANSLLDVLQRKRQQGIREHSKIPIIFLGHSLGGLVIKQALLNASASARFKPTWEAAFGLVFFGTPHGGGNTGEIAAFAANVAKFFANDRADNTLLMCLKPNSLFTQESTERFSEQLDKYRILTFFETRPMKFHGINRIVVSRKSAILGAPHEVRLDLNRDHRNICKFAKRGHTYDIFRGNLEDIVSRALGSVEPISISNSQLHVLNPQDISPSSSSITENQQSPHPDDVENRDIDLSLRLTAISTYESYQIRSQETIPSRDSESISQNYVSAAYVKELNDRFSKAVKELDTLLIHNWIKDPSRRSKLNAENIRSALLDLAGLKEEAKDPRFRVHAVNIILDECDVELECVDNTHKATPLILAAICGREAITKLLIDKGASLQAKDGKLGRTPLHWAARNNWVRAADLLLKALDEKQDLQTIQSKDIDGHTALGLSYQRRHVEMARLIESYGGT